MNQPPGEESLKTNVPEVPDFDLLRPIGEGGFGRVWMARNRTTGRLRAVKLIAKSRVGTADPAGREMASITRLEATLRHHHPNLVTIHHVGQTDDHLFYVMDLADDAGGTEPIDPERYEPATLRRRLDDGPLDPQSCVACARQLLEGLASLHHAGMVHRDVKPANCLFIAGQLRLADFGLLTRPGVNVSRIGTEKYMPPDGRMDARADVYAAGLVIYEMLTGYSADRFPQLGDRSAAVLADPALGVLMGLTLDACSPDPQTRYADAGAMLRELDRRLARSPCPVKPGRRPWIAPLVLAVVVLAGIGVWRRPWIQRTDAPSTPIERVSVNFITYPFDATILVDGRTLIGEDGIPLKTPCTADDLPDGRHRVAFRFDGRGELPKGEIDFSVTRQIVARWDAVESP
ncbi:MAG TPA: serine/threonine-protein kinase [Thermoguttaceae bacterium]|nr:serine/threonine-protein kinase [Thermoguttaceae bacterium]